MGRANDRAERHPRFLASIGKPDSERQWLRERQWPGSRLPTQEQARAGVAQLVLVVTMIHRIIGGVHVSPVAGASAGLPEHDSVRRGLVARGGLVVDPMVGLTARLALGPVLGLMMVGMPMMAGMPMMVGMPMMAGMPRRFVGVPVPGLVSVK